MAKKKPSSRYASQKQSPARKRKAAKTPRPAPQATNALTPPGSLWAMLEQQKLFVAIGLALLTFVVFSPSLQNTFTNWDDDRYVVNNPDIRGFGGEQLENIFSQAYVSNYQPVAVLSLSLNYAISGDKPFSYILVNILLHVLNTVLVFYFVYMLSMRRIEVALLVALLFGVHPMHVESVSWISERKDVLYTFFFMGGLITYLRYLDNKEMKFLLYTLGLFVLSVLSKPAAVIFPLVLVAIYWYKGEKLEVKGLLFTVPFFVISLIMGLVTIKMQSATAIEDIGASSLGEKFLYACYGFVMYIVKLVAPVNLSAFYPYPDSAGNAPATFYIMPVLALAIAGIAVWSIRKTRLIAFGLAFYLINIILVLQFLQVGSAIMADRYTYVAYIGLFFILGMGFSHLLHREVKPWAQVATIALILMGLGFSYLSFERTKVWKNSETLWTDVIEKFPREVPVSYLNRGNFRFRENRGDEAVKDWDIAIQIKQDYHEAYQNRGVYKYNQKQHASAIEDFNKAIELNPQYTNAFKNRGRSHLALNQHQKALADFQAYSRLNPRDDFAYNGMAVSYFGLKNYQKATEAYDNALRLSPNNAGYYLNRSKAFYQLQNVQKARADYQKAKQLGATIDANYRQIMGE